MRPTIACVVVVAALAATGAAKAQSFDCRAGHFSDERVICADPRLSELDNRLNAAFNRRSARLSPQQRDMLEEEEIDWLMSRHACGRDYRCIEESYLNRIDELSEGVAVERSRDRREDKAAGRDLDDEDRVKPARRAVERSGSTTPSSTSSSSTAVQSVEKERKSRDSSTARTAARAPEPAAVEHGSGSTTTVTRTTTTVTRAPEHHAPRNRAATTATAAAAPAAAAPPPQPPAPAAPGKPSIQWVDPAPAR